VATKIDRDDDVPRLPRGSGLKLSTAAIFRILLTAALLVMIVVAQRPCADAVSGFVTSFDHEPGGSGSAAPQAQMPKPGTVDVPRTDPCAEPLRADMNEAEMAAAIERAKQCAKLRQAAPGDAGKVAPPQP
jgi:hypothetical protein